MLDPRDQATEQGRVKKLTKIARSRELVKSADVLCHRLVVALDPLVERILVGGH